MDWGGPEFVLAIIAMGTLGSIVRHAISAKHGLEPEGRRGRRNRQAADTDETIRLRSENAELRAHLAKIEDRTRVLERIVTDKSSNTSSELASQIEALRDQPGANGVPLAFEQERV